ncbi:glycosyltransferase [Bacillus sp. JCM 19046]|nr:glycosyltransferase [Bacillus sp. JCM 19046]
MDKVKVLMLGSSENVRGGITTVVNGFRGESFSDSINVQYVSTHFNVNKIYNIIGYLFAYLKVFFIMINSRPDVVHMHMSERGSFIRKYYLFKLCKLFDIPVILHMHGAEFEEYYHSSNPKIQVRIREFLKEARLVVALGERWSEIIKEIEPLSNVQIMYNAVTLPSHEIRIEQNKVVNILFLAVVIERKRH